jgi:hypothetical protein
MNDDTGGVLMVPTKIDFISGADVLRSSHEHRLTITGTAY